MPIKVEQINVNLFLDTYNWRAYYEKAVWRVTLFLTPNVPLGFYKHAEPIGTSFDAVSAILGYAKLWITR